MALKHRVFGWTHDVTRNKLDRISQISVLSHDDMEWINYGCPSESMYALTFSDNLSTHYLTVEQLNELYPYVGTDLATIEVLYGNTSR